MRPSLAPAQPHGSEASPGLAARRPEPRRRVRWPSRWLRDERGGVLVFTVIALPVLVLCASLVIDVGNWFEHKRHLQMQADSAALAAALDMRHPCSDATVTDTAASYGGRDWNPQVQNKQPNVHMLINSDRYYNQSSPVDTTVDTRPPCTSAMIDVKLTETDLPWYFKLAQVPFINAHARVGLYTIDSYIGSLPLAVPEVDPKKVVAKFVDESKTPSDPDYVLATKELTKVGLSNGLVIWDNATAPLPVTVDREKIGVRIIISGSSSTNCGDPLVDCFDGGSSNGVVYLRGWSGAGSATQPNAPLARDVTLVPGTCADAYFTSSGTSCTIGVRAKVEFGGIPSTGASLTANIGGKTNYPLTYDPATGLWESALTIPIAPGAGPVPVTLDWKVTSGTIGTTACTSKSPCTGSFGTVQRSFAGSDARSGPLRLVEIQENSVPGANSVERCSAVQTSCTHDLVVRIGVPPGLEVAQSVNDPIVELRFSGGGSQSQGLDCDPNLDGSLNPNYDLFEVELIYGCRPYYKPNEGTACPPKPADLWATAQPWDCVANQTGQYVNKIPKGLNERILCTPPNTPPAPGCDNPSKPTICNSPNNWSMFDDPGGLPENDPRIVQLFVTQYGAFSESGGYTVPITRFATFYITGWDGSGSGFPNPCQGNGDDPAADGTIVGHFIKYIDTFQTSSGTELCNLSDTSPCTPLLVE
jgi:Flp pilus assembly protein TadG